MCTTFPETSAVLYASAAAVAASGVDSSALTRGPESGVCVVRGCNDGTLNGRVLVCASPCTQMRPADGETIEVAAPGTKTTAQKAA
ncbi:hypothetical protein HYH02_009824 [Chlamydomonas schloesseri]|uniref:Uncharacterized protein n=1 Tax=Chlamydomonas schloesseri TaxID=2026947 RepID=A0A835W663_9CHLO|nr:hypothetical protein HYH02_009824 [Chlamydomonas schloesseri]|eukprot:KAG2442032.1 hypothetical protein HYH02_009824 [Chlamydomonas schloesseri]